MAECGCKVQGVETVGGPGDGALIGTLIVYCPMHLAAHDMLEALKHAVDQYDNIYWWLERAKEAIAKAEG